MKNTIQKLLKVFFFGTLFFSIVSCDKDLDVEPESEIAAEYFYSSTEEMEFALIAVYSSLQNLMNVEWIVTELRSDNTYMNVDSSSSSDLPLRTIDRFEVISTNEHVTEYYRSAYSTIALANRVLANLEIIEDVELRNQFEGEAKFIRALAYFKLVRLFGPVPIVDRVITGQQGLDIERSPREDVYRFIVTDLTLASEYLPEAYDQDNVGRATKWAAMGILGKAYLTQGENQAAIDVLEQIVADGPNRLLDDYEDVFDPGNEYNAEILFAVRYQSGNLGLGAPFANFFAPVQSDDYVVTGGGDAFNVPTESISNSYESEERKDPSMANVWFGQDGTENFRNYITKYNSSFSVVDDAGNDWPVLRYSDVLLMLAEAYNELGNTSQALEYLNDVRTRVDGLEPYEMADVSSYFDFKIALEEERRVEFAFENQRWFDLLRTGRALTVMNQHFNTEFQYNDPDDPESPVTPIEEWQLVLPIPQYAIDLNPNIAQNIGY
jgi:tetratricopeptide (TPR) repeat protein